MSDKELTELGRQAGNGDLEAAVRLVMTILRGATLPEPWAERVEFRREQVESAAFRQLADELRTLLNMLDGSGNIEQTRHFLVQIISMLRVEPFNIHVVVPPTSLALAARNKLSAQEAFMGHGGYSPDKRDTLARWLVMHQGRVITLSQDPMGFEAISPPEHVKRLEKQVKWLEQEIKRFADLYKPFKALSEGYTVQGGKAVKITDPCEEGGCKPGCPHIAPDGARGIQKT